MVRFGAMAAALAATMALTIHCSSGSAGALDDAGTGTTDGGTSVPGCPKNPPTHGTSCSLADGTRCNDYASPGCACCSPTTYTCLGGKWNVVTGGPPPVATPACPDTVPDAGEPCTNNPCVGAVQSCQYDCQTGKGANATAICNGTWQVTVSRSACELDGGLDAPADG